MSWYKKCLNKNVLWTLIFNYTHIDYNELCGESDKRSLSCDVLGLRH